MLQEVALQLSHRNLELRKSLCEVVGQLILLWVESQEEPSHLGEAGVAEESMEVSPSRSQKGWVELLSVVGGHEQDSSLLGSDSVESVQEARERDSSSLITLVDRLSGNRDTVDIFK